MARQLFKPHSNGKINVIGKRNRNLRNTMFLKHSVIELYDWKKGPKLIRKKNPFVEQIINIGKVEVSREIQV